VLRREKVTSEPDFIKALRAIRVGKLISNLGLEKTNYSIGIFGLSFDRLQKFEGGSGEIF